MKGVILAGGTGTRLRPMTYVANKHLLPVYDRPMLYYPIETLVKSGITDILVVTGREHMGAIVQTLGSGVAFGCQFTYKVQDEAGGIAQALYLARDFSQGASLAVILGDNIFTDTFTFTDFTGGGRIYLKKVGDSQRFGVAAFGEDGSLLEIQEKPAQPPTDYAVTGLYLYDKTVFRIIEQCKPSTRGELEISDVNNHYLRHYHLEYRILDGFWSDAGTPDSLFRATQYMQERS